MLFDLSFLKIYYENLLPNNFDKLISLDPLSELDEKHVIVKIKFYN